MERIPEALTWTNSDCTRLVHGMFVTRVTNALENLVRAVGESRPELEEALRSVSDDVLMRVLLAPDVTARLLWRDYSPTATTAKFFCECLMAEAARPSWTAPGDRDLLPSDDMSAPVAGILPLDLDKPDVDAPGFRRYPDDIVGCTPLKSQERDAVLRRLTASYQEIVASNSVLGDFVATFGKALVLRRTEGSEFTSFSSPNYVGRITLINPHLVDEVLLAESLVHESIHSLLFMHDHGPVWGLNPTEGGAPGNAYSPWTGRRLPVTTFLQACFVWFGLLTFWGHVLRTGSFPSGTGMVRMRLARAAAGFMRGPLLDNVQECDSQLVKKEVTAAVEDIDRRVSALLGDRSI